MAIRVCVLASGSSGNSVFISSESTAILIDAGLSCRELERRLTVAGSDLGKVRAVCVSHEHDDHKSALKVLYRRCGLPVYANSGTAEAIDRAESGTGIAWTVFSVGFPFDIGDLRVLPFSVPHDSYDPVGFVVSHRTDRIAVVTDIGMATSLVRERLKGCQAVIVESNHDKKMLEDAARPWSLKQRIAGRQGHLSNAQAAELVVESAGQELRVVFLAHLSRDCNTPELALRTMRAALDRAGRSDVDVKMTYPDRISDIVQIEG